MTKEEIISRFVSNDKDVFYGTMYGGEYRSILTEDGVIREKDKAIEIKKTEVEFDPDNGFIIFIWGGPGPDYNVYRFSDYGKTWAFSMDEVDCELYE